MIQKLRNQQEQAKQAKQAKHEYLRDTFDRLYRECADCKNRSQFTCVRCGVCYSCHWKKEIEQPKEIHKYIILGDN